MKKIVQIFLVACLVIIGAQSAFAGEKVWFDENYDLSGVHRLMIAEPNYAQFKDGATKEEIMDMFQQQGISSMYVLKKSDVEKNILRDAGIDVGTLDAEKAKKVLDAHMDKYVDAYMVATVIHNRRITIFYDMFSAKTKERIFTEQIIAGSSDKDTLATYQKLTAQFYKDFQKEAKKQDKKNKK